MLITDITEGSGALLCTTNNSNCCSDTELRAGEFYFPIQSPKNGEVVPVQGEAMADYYRDRQTQHIRLHRQSEGDITGQFRCEMPTSNKLTMNLSYIINIGRCATQLS